MRRSLPRQSILRIFEGKKDFVLGSLKGLLLSILIAVLFYRDIRGMAVFPVCLWVLCKKEKKAGRERRQERLRQQFAEFLGFLEEALLAGYSLEKAVGEAKRGMETTYGEDFFIEALTQMQRKMALGGTVEEAFAQFADGIKCEEASEFAEVLYIAKRTGGAVRQVIVNTEGILRRKQETLCQVKAAMHSKMYENGLMKYMPFAMLLYLQAGMPDFLKPLYHNLAGIVFMTVILLCYAGLCLMVDKISQIEA